MTELAKNLWAFMLAALFFGMWVFPIILAVAIVMIIIRFLWPDLFYKMF